MTAGGDPTQHRARVNGIDLAYLEWVEPSGDAVIGRLGDHHVVAVDQRGHGGTVTAIGRAPPCPSPIAAREAGWEES
jgi:pimeloyl-ACP methyl ester carboxylesterase